MIFTLEALEAKHGDALVLYHGTGDGARSVVVIDGGPNRVYRESLRRRLESLRRPGKDLHIPLMMVSHLDEDHIQGLVDLTDELVRMLDPKHLPQDIRDLPAHKRPKLPYRIDSLWYNGFDRILDNKEEELKNLAASVVTEPDAGDVRPLSETLPASVRQGLRLRANIDKLPISVNDGSQLILAPAEGRLVYAFDPADKSFYKLGTDEEPEEGALKLTVLGPTPEQLTKLHTRWDKDLKKIIKKEKEEEEAEGATYKDTSPFNLSSTVVLAEVGKMSMLLTGDARGDYTIASAEQAGLLEDGVLRVDLLKMPHHGSDHNVDVDYFRTFPADHYVISADGRDENPAPRTFEYLFEARADDDRPFTIYLTNETGTPGKNETHMAALVAELNNRVENDPRVTVVYRKPDEPSVIVNLADPVKLPKVE